MLRTNLTFGFEEVAQMYEMQRRLGPADLAEAGVPSRAR